MSEQQVEEVQEASTTSEPIAEETQIESAPIVVTEEIPEVVQESDPEKTKLSEKAQARFDEITREKYALQNELDAATAKLKERDEVKVQPTEDPGDMPKLSDESIGYDEEKHAVAVKVWAEKKADVKAEKTVSAREQEANRVNEQTEFNKKVAKYQTNSVELEKKYPDLKESIAKMPIMNNGALNAAFGAGPEVMYHLSKNSELLHKINKMTPIEGAYEVGKLEIQLSTTNKKLISGAPEPITPIKGGGVINTALPGEELIRGAKFR